MNFILAIPLPLRLALLFLLGTLVGGLINWAVYALAWNRRAISPWSGPPKGAAPRRATDRIPLVGWLQLRRESALHGRGFWIRPLLVELVSGILLAGLYLWETQLAPAVWALPGSVPPPADFLSADLPLVAHARFLSHAILLALMLAASLVDLDEKTIPDAITIPGTLAGLALAFVYPWSLLPAAQYVINAVPHVEFLTLASPAFYPSELNGFPERAGLAVALACWTLWCGGLLPRYWNTRHGWSTAVRVLFHRLRSQRSSYAIALMWLVGAAAVMLAAWRAPQGHWAGLVTALVGVAGGGALIWTVRTIGAAVLGREAMGFGDVTLVSMIGAFLGWQACLMIFFVAPFFGLAFAIAGWIIRREREIPYGPFLCLAALAVMLQWAAFWDRTVDIFSLGWVVPALFGGCLVMLALLLWVYRTIGQLLTRGR